MALLLYAILTWFVGCCGAEDFRAVLEVRLRKLQFPTRKECGCRRALLYTGAYYEGFACAVHQVGLAQLVALATNRTLVVPDKDVWGYVSGKQCAARNWNCLFEPLSSCSERDLKRCGSKATSRTAAAASNALQNYHTIAGPARIVTYVPRGSTSKHGSVHKQLYKDEVLKGWLNAAGSSFQLRSEVQRWLWKPLPELKKGVQKEVGRIRRAEGLPAKYSAIHVRASDNLANTQKDFGIRPATYSTRNFLSHLQRARASVGAGVPYPPGSTMPVYVSTDNVAVIKELERWHGQQNATAGGFTFIYNRESAQRAKYKDGLLHRKNKDDSAAPEKVGQTALDAVVAVEMLSGADYILGSQISNIFRLATELHCAQRSYATCGSIVRREDGSSTVGDSVQTVDVAWYQDP